MKKLIARDECGCKVKLTQDRGMWVNHEGLSYTRDGSILMLNGEHSTHDLTILSEEVETDSGTLTTTVAPWTTDGGTGTIPWDNGGTYVYAGPHGELSTVAMYMASPVRDDSYSPVRWNFPHPETREPVTRENLYDWIIQAAVDGKIKRCDHEEHYTKIQCPACQGVGWVLK
jgi:hypothetical protein